MARTLRSFLRAPRIWLPATSLAIYSSASRSKLDEPEFDPRDAAADKAQAKVAQREEILKAAQEFTVFTDSSPSGQPRSPS
jgi:hypothetical protein